MIKQTKNLRTVIPAVLNQIRQGATFMSIKGYVDNFDGLSNFGIVFHVNYIKAVKKSLNIWYTYKPRNELERRARKDLLDSYRDTLQGHNPRALSAHSYSAISDGQKLIRSVKWHDNGKACHFWGFGVHKVSLRPADYPADSRGDLSVVRRQLIGMTPLGRFRQFKIAEGRFDSIGVEKLTLTQQDLLRSIDKVTV